MAKWGWCFSKILTTCWSWDIFWERGGVLRVLTPPTPFPTKCPLSILRELSKIRGINWMNTHLVYKLLGIFSTPKIPSSQNPLCHSRATLRRFSSCRFSFSPHSPPSYPGPVSFLLKNLHHVQLAIVFIWQTKNRPLCLDVFVMLQGRILALEMVAAVLAFSR